MTMFSSYACRATGQAFGSTSAVWMVSATGRKIEQRAIHKSSDQAIRSGLQSLIENQTRFKNTYSRSFSEKVKTDRKSFVEWYEGHLTERPVLTKMITGSFLWGVGDAVAQLMPKAMENFNADSNSNDFEKKKEFSHDWMRTGRAVFFGFALHAPTSHVHYNFLEWMTVRAGVKGLAIPVFKAFMEQFVYWSWISNSMYHGAMGAMQGLTPTQIYNRIADVLWETQKAQWVFWIPVQLLNFRFVPVRHQLNVVLVTSVVWTAFLSAYYPPEPNTKKIEEKQSQ